MFHRILALSIAATALVSGPAIAEWAPKGPITMMIGYSAGGAADSQARLIADEIEARKGWRIIPVNIDGKAGVAMAAKLATEPADGTAIGMGSSEVVGYAMVADKKPGYKESDFTYLATTAETQQGVVARADRGWKTMEDVFTAMKKGRAVSFAALSPKIADAAYLLAKSRGLSFNIVNVKGGKGVMDAVIAGDVDIGIVAGAQARMVASGDLVNLASAEGERLKMSPNAPTMKELGADIELGAKFMFMAPKGLPADARAALTNAITEVVTDPKSKSNAYIKKTMGDVQVLKGAELDRFISENAVAARRFLKMVMEK